MSAEKSSNFRTDGLGEDQSPQIGLLIPGDEGAVTAGTEENPLHVQVSAEATGAAVTLQATALGALEVANAEARRLSELLFIQNRNMSLLSLQTRHREQITLIDRRGSDGQRGR